VDRGGLLRQRWSGANTLTAPEPHIPRRKARRYARILRLDEVRDLEKCDSLPFLAYIRVPLPVVFATSRPTTGCLASPSSLTTPEAHELS
jgi:hypothetical protein